MRGWRRSPAKRSVPKPDRETLFGHFQTNVTLQSESTKKFEPACTGEASPSRTAASCFPTCQNTIMVAYKANSWSTGRRNRRNPGWPKYNYITIFILQWSKGRQWLRYPLCGQSIGYTEITLTWYNSPPINPPLIEITMFSVVYLCSFRPVLLCSCYYALPNVAKQAGKKNVISCRTWR